MRVADPSMVETAAPSTAERRSTRASRGANRPDVTGARLAATGDVLRDLEAWGSARDWIGPDPYEGLNAKRLITPLLRTQFSRRLCVQAVKRCPVNLRPLLGIEPAENSAALAWVASAYALGGFTSASDASQKLRRIIERLERLRCGDYAEPCWGYHFDHASRVLFLPSTAPNTIATAYVIAAMLDAYDQTGDEHLLDLALGAGDFFLAHIPQTKASQGAYFGYLPGNRSPVHNANMHAGAILARLSRYADRPAFRRAAVEAIRYTTAHQRPDGSWPYGEASNIKWVDNFHTGYLLDCLKTCAGAGVEPARCMHAYALGIEYYRRALFLDDGTPKYFAHSTYPIDMQCVAQGIQTFAIAGEEMPEFLDAAWATFDFALRRMRRGDGAFMFQRRRLWTNRVPHMRGVVASMLLALTHLLHGLESHA
jgi:hypothetical protein